MIGDEETVRQIVNRLKRAQGQLSAVIGMIEQDRDCREIVTQLAAVSKAVDRAGFKVMSCGMRSSLSGEEGALTEEELEKLFLSLA